MDALDFLTAVAGAARPDLPPGARLATIDPAYDSHGAYPDIPLPNVTFDGETSMSTKQYTVLADYIPTASDRVLMVPVGRTYVIVGSIRRNGTIDRPDGIYQAVGDQSIANAADVTVAFSGTITASPLVSRSVSGAGHEFTLARPGLWNATANLRFAALANGERAIHFHRSGSFTAVQGSPGSIGAPTTLNVSLTRRYDEGDTFYVQAFQNSGGSATLTTDNTLALGRLYLTWLGP